MLRRLPNRRVILALAAVILPALACGSFLSSTPSQDALGYGPPKKCKPANKKTGPGYATLTPKMKAALARLYSNIEELAGCYRFTIGFRGQDYQDRLRRRWHDIADRSKNDKRTEKEICDRLHKAGFAQCPAGYKRADEHGEKVAKGGPAKKSRHTEDQAADISVRWPDEPNLLKYQQVAAIAGLCGPPAGDKVHVELPYSRVDKHHKKAAFKCHFPEGPAPAGSQE